MKITGRLSFNVRCRRHCLKFTAAVMIAALAAAGCGKAPAPRPPGAAIHTLMIGGQDEPKTLNPLKMQDVWSWNACMLLYESLYSRNPQTFEIIPWLAEGEPEYDQTANTCVVRMKKGALWDDGVPVTARDVAFTGQLMIEFKIPRFYSGWSFVEKVEALDDCTIRYTLKEPYAVFYTDTLMSIILPEHAWAPIVAEVKKAADPLTNLLDYRIEQPVGMGAFKFKEWNKGSYVKLVKNDRYFATGMEVKGQRVGPYIDEILLKVYGTTDAAILALKKGDIDFYWWPIQPGFVETLKTDPRIGVTENAEDGFKYLAFNVRRAPFNDVSFRRATAYLIDKDFIVKRVLQGYGERNDNIVPPGNAYWFNPETPKFGKGMSPAERMKKAVEILKQAGYSWEREPGINDRGEIEAGSGLTMPGGEKIKPFTLLTPPADYDPQRAMSGTFIQQWWREAGIPVTAAPTSFGDIVNKVHSEWNFDTYLLGWTLAIDPDYLRGFFHSREIVKDGYNSMGYSNPGYDRLAESSAREMDLEERRAIILKMQDYIIREAPMIPLYSAAKIEAFRKDRFTGWVDQLEGIGNGWSFVFLKPVERK